jgi:hypothetical protein
MHSSCSDKIAALPPAICGMGVCSNSFETTYYPSPTELAALEQLANEPYRAELAQVDAALEARADKMQRIRLVVGDHYLAAAVTRHLAERKVDEVEVQVASSAKPTMMQHGIPIALDMPDVKKGYWDSIQPRHCSLYTKSQSSPKARKAARKRAKAGRKAAR